MARTLPASPERVWRALTDAKELTAWYWPQRLNPSVTVDLRVGGGYRISASSPEMAVSGSYLELDAPRRLVAEWTWDGEDGTSVVTIDLAGDSTHTDLVLVHDQLGPDEVESHEQGWSDCLDRLPEHLD